MQQNGRRMTALQFLQQRSLDMVKVLRLLFLIFDYFIGQIQFMGKHEIPCIFEKMAQVNGNFTDTA